jgi:hypothetical protein
MVQRLVSSFGIMSHIVLNYLMICPDPSKFSPFNLQSAPQLVRPLAYALFPDLVYAHLISQETVVNLALLVTLVPNAKRVPLVAPNVTRESQAQESVSLQLFQQTTPQTATAKTVFAGLAEPALVVRDGRPVPAIRLNATPALVGFSSTHLATAKVAEQVVRHVPPPLEHV